MSKGHPHLRVSLLAKRYGSGIHNNVAGNIVTEDAGHYRVDPLT